MEEEKKEAPTTDFTELSKLMSKRLQDSAKNSAVKRQTRAKR
jgi:hypothetical protein